MNIKNPATKSDRCCEETGLKELEISLRTTKEIVVKFIEMGKVTPSTLPEVFTLVHRTVTDAVSADKAKSMPDSHAAPPHPPKPSTR